MLRRVIRGTAMAGVAALATYELSRLGRAGWQRRANTRALPGDDLVDAPRYADTDALTIDAPPSAVWPWLIQMGYGRAGWYCCTRCNRVDLEPHEEWRILPQFQALAAGAILPAHAEGGFRVVTVEHERTLVLHVNAAAARERATTYNGAGRRPAADPDRPHIPDIPAFDVSWSFVLEALPGQRTRLIARYRAALPPAARDHRLLQPVTGLGIFWMQRKQLRGIKLRAEYSWRGGQREARVGLAA